MPDYTNIQFIAYEIDTAPKDAVFVNGQLIGGTYLGLPDISQDIAQRAQLMFDAIQTAAANAAVSADSATLKIFMAPEFFFRGPIGAYTMDQVQEVIGTLQGLLVGAQWANWMFVFGTIVGYSDIDNENLEIVLGNTYNKAINSFYEMYNVVLVQTGGYATAADAEPLANVIMKENMSNMDFITMPTQGMDWRIVDHLPPLAPPGPGQEQQINNYDGLGIFQANGLTFGVEVCLDHLTGRLSASPVAPGQPMVMAQLVPSCGATLQNGAIVAQDNGYAFNVDGNVNPSSVARQVNATLPIASTTAAVNPANYNPVVDTAQLYVHGPGQVRIYNSVALPAQQYVTGQMMTNRFTDGDVIYDFVFWYEPQGTGYVFSRVYCTVYFADLSVMIQSICLPVVNGMIGGTITMNASVQQGSFPGTTNDLGVWMELNLNTYNFQGIIITFPSVFPG